MIGTYQVRHEPACRGSGVLLQLTGVDGGGSQHREQPDCNAFFGGSREMAASNEV